MKDEQWIIRLLDSILANSSCPHPNREFSRVLLMYWYWRRHTLDLDIKRRKSGYTFVMFSAFHIISKTSPSPKFSYTVMLEPRGNLIGLTELCCSQNAACFSFNFFSIRRSYPLNGLTTFTTLVNFSHAILSFQCNW